MSSISTQSNTPADSAIADAPAGVGLPDAVEVTGETCPKCHTTKPWKASSWCPDCGYYPGVSDALPESERAATELMNAPAEAATDQPLMAPWLVRAIAIPSMIIVGSMLVRVYFNYFGGERGLIALAMFVIGSLAVIIAHLKTSFAAFNDKADICLLYTSPSPRDATLSRMPSSA